MNTQELGQNALSRRLRADLTPAGGSTKPPAPLKILPPINDARDAMLWAVTLAKMTAAGNLHPREARRAREQIRAFRIGLDRRDGES